MEKELELIQVLRSEVKDFDLLREKAIKEYTDTVNEFDCIFNNIQKNKPKLEETKLAFDNLIEGKVLNWIGPPTIVIVAITFAVLMIAAKSNFPWPVYMLGSILCGTGFYMISSAFTLFLFRGRVVKHLIKKYPHIMKVYNKMKELENVICSDDRRLMELRDRKEIMKRKLAGVEDQLNRKREELNNEEEKYFNSLVGKTIVTEDGKQFIVGSVGKGKSKVKILEDK